MDKSRKKIAQDESRNAIADSKSSSAAVRKDGKYEGKQAIKEAAGEGPKMYGKKEKGPKTFEGGAHRGEMKHGKDGSHQGPKMYGEDHGPKMTSDSQSYRSSMSKHWHQSNLLKENPIVNHATEK
jgi:hypothetical protein|tara:strand:- start:320 stop:694 length:375 start_codon:yes stop_codon:yes gene_type:complete